MNKANLIKPITAWKNLEAKKRKKIIKAIVLFSTVPLAAAIYYHKPLTDSQFKNAWLFARVGDAAALIVQGLVNHEMGQQISLFRNPVYKDKNITPTFHEIPGLGQKALSPTDIPQNCEYAYVLTYRQPHFRRDVSPESLLTDEEKSKINAGEIKLEKDFIGHVVGHLCKVKNGQLIPVCALDESSELTKIPFKDRTKENFMIPMLVGQSASHPARTAKNYQPFISDTVQVVPLTQAQFHTANAFIEQNSSAFPARQDANGHDYPVYSLKTKYGLLAPIGTENCLTGVLRPLEAAGLHARQWEVAGREFGKGSQSFPLAVSPIVVPNESAACINTGVRRMQQAFVPNGG